MIPHKNTYIPIIVFLCFVALAEVLWCIIINRKQKTMYYSIGNIMIAFSFLLLAARNELYNLIDAHKTPLWLLRLMSLQRLDALLVQTTYLVMLLQVAGWGYFIMAYNYQKRFNHLP